MLFRSRAISTHGTCYIMQMHIKVMTRSFVLIVRRKRMAPLLMRQEVCTKLLCEEHVLLDSLMVQCTSLNLSSNTDLAGSPAEGALCSKLRIQYLLVKLYINGIYINKSENSFQSINHLF